MATASIRIDQSTHTTTPIGVVGRARDDLEIAEQVTLRNGDDSGVYSWRWVLLARPTGSTAALSNPIAATATFTPDIVGTYRVRLTVNEGLLGEVDTTVAVVRDPDGLRIPAAGETTEANWLIGGSPNERGWHPDMEAYLAFLKTYTAQFVLDNIITDTFVAATVDDYDPGSPWPVAQVLRLTPNAAGTTLNGLVAPTVAMQVLLCNLSTVDNIVIAHEAVASTAENRFVTANATNITVRPTGSSMAWYDLTSQRWRAR